MFDVAHDVVHATEQLPPQLRELCERLMYGSVSDVARETGVSRSLKSTDGSALFAGGSNEQDCATTCNFFWTHPAASR